MNFTRFHLNSCKHLAQFVLVSEELRKGINMRKHASQLQSSKCDSKCDYSYQSPDSLFVESYEIVVQTSY